MADPANPLTPPPVAGETASPRVRGRFVLADGSPWPRAVVHASSWQVPGHLGSDGDIAIPVDSDGRFDWVLTARPTDGGRLGYRLFANHPDGGTWVTGNLDLSGRMLTDETEVGDVRLDHGLDLVRGRVLDGDGAPVARARLHVRVPYGAGSRVVAIEGRTQTGDDGTFALFAATDQDLPAGGFAVHARAGGFLPGERTPFEPGARGVDLRLVRAGTVTGTLRLLAGQLAPDFALVLSPSDEFRPLVPTVADDGSFRFEGLAPGSYTFRADLARGRSESGTSRSGRAPTDDAAVVVAQVLVRAGVITADPRLQQVTVAAILDRLVLCVVDQDGKPIAGAVARRLDGPTRASGDDRMRSGRDGRITALGVGEPLDLEIDAFGYRPATVGDVTRDRDIVLRRGIAVTLRCRGVPAHATDPRYDLGLRFFGPIDREGQRRMLWPETTPLDRIYFDAGGELRMQFPAPGRYVADPFVFVIGRDNVGRGGNLGLDPPIVVDVRDLDEEQHVAIDVPRDRLDEFLRRLVR